MKDEPNPVPREDGAGPGDRPDHAAEPSPARPQRLCQLFHATLECSPEQRSSFLARACGGDEQLRTEIEQLLAQHARAGTENFLADLLSGSLFPPEPLSPARHHLVGRRVGPYEIRAFLASGGMGSVFEAVRVDDYEQVVAMKVLRAELFTEELGERFYTERQALAQLAHPNIARLLDGGTADGLPYLVMEYIPGRSIDEYCDEEQLSVEQRLRLFAVVCRAVHFAHQAGILHRDLKPGNILVTPDGTPRLTDFGLAKRLGHDSAQTLTGQILGTPSYVAPEQAAGQMRDATAATDVYSLGAVLYELLTGKPPCKGATWRETLEQVCTQEPLSPRRLQPGLARDLETICLRCLQKQPGRRYPSAEAVAQDVERFLAGRPILARPVGRSERVYRWCKRNPLVAGLLTGLVLVLAGGLGGVTWMWRLAEERSATARREQEEADRQRERAERMAERGLQALENQLKRVIDSKELKTPGLEPLRKTMVELVVPNYEELAREVTGDMQQQRGLARLYFRVTQILRNNGDHAQALRAGEKAVPLYEQFVRDNPDSVEDLRYLAWIYSDLGIVLGNLERREEAFQAEKKALALRKRMVEINPASPNAQRYLAWSYTNLGNYTLRGDE